MVNKIPDNWIYSDEIELLYMFYQVSEELLNARTPDTYRLPVHNSITLSNEIKRVYRYLNDNKLMDNYYANYICPIISELIDSIHNDKVLKLKLGKRLDRVLTGLEEAKKDYKIIRQWIDILKQSCSSFEYIDAYKKLIVKTIEGKKNKRDLLIYANNYYISLIEFGYSKNYLYDMLTDFFLDGKTQIDSVAQVNDFLEIFNYESQEYEFYFVADNYLLNYFSEFINLDLKEIMDIKIVEDIMTLRTQAKKNENLFIFLNKYDDLVLHSPTEKKIEIAKMKSKGVDPYAAYNRLSSTVELTQIIMGYFKHYTKKTQIYDCIIIENDSYRLLDTYNYNDYRPYINDEKLKGRINAFLAINSLTELTFSAMVRSFVLHLDAISSQSSETKIRTFWTALETLYLADGDQFRASAVEGTLYIIQKTFILKYLRLLYSSIIEAIEDDSFWKELNICCFQEFVLFFISYREQSDEFKKIYKKLDKNPLLRSRLFQLRKDMCSSKKIVNMIQKHKEKCRWHLQRIYRTRNLSTHAGATMPYIDEAVYNLHHYYDFVLNYILCKIENDHRVESISSLLYETKVDNEYHFSEMYHDPNDIMLNRDNGLELLFGPDYRIYDYDFEGSYLR